MTVTAEKVVRYEPRGAARELFSCTADEILLDGPAGTGKSLAALYRLHFACLKHPGIKCLIVRKTGISLGSTTLRTFDEKVAADALSQGVVRWYGGSRREPACYKYSNGSRIVVGGMDQPVKIMSSEYDLAFCDEATELIVDDLEAITTRLRNGVLPWGQQVIVACNPAHRTHWLNQRAKSGAMRRLVSRHRDNPRYVNADGTLTEEGALYLAKLDNLTGVRKLRLRDGIWAAAEGIIYEGWDEAVHLIDPFPIPDEWTRWWAVDFGYTNPMVIQNWAEDGDGRLYLYRETYQTKRTVPEHARAIMQQVADEDPHVPGRWHWKERKPRGIICDHDAEGRVVLSQEVGIGTIPAKKGKTEGIQIVQERMKIAGDGQPRIFFMRNCVVRRDPDLLDAKKPTSTEEEVPGYVWLKPGAAAQSQAPKEEPLDEDNHGCLVAGTLVRTPDGTVPIEAVRAGDRVLTRAGSRVVLAAGMTSPRAVVYRVGLSNGRALAGTGNHPVYVEGHGWKRLDALRYADRLVACHESSRSASAASSSADTPTPRTGQNAATTCPTSPSGSAELDASTRRSGNRPTAPSQLATRSITATSTRSTTPWRIWPVSLWPSTRQHTVTEAGSGATPRCTGTTLSGPASWPPRGTGRTKDANGIGRTLRPSSSVVPRNVSSSVSSAVSSTPQPLPTPTAGSAPTTASPHGGAPAASTTSSEHARIAGMSSPSTGTPRRNAVAVSVLSVSALGERAPVFNLTVADEAEYYANGVLVHNCDGMRYLCSEREIGAPRIRSMG